MVDTPGLASAARRLLRSTEAGTLGVSASSASRTFVLTHEGRPLLAAGDLRPGAQAELAVAGADPARVIVAGALRAATPAEAARFAAFSSDSPVLCLEPATVRVEGAAGEVTLAAADFLLPTPEWLEGEQGILDHMNEDHEDSMLRMSLHYFGTEAKTARLIAADPEGLHVRTDRGVQYFPFDRRATTHDDVHHATVHLARTARMALAARPKD
jgi:heme iron utilization protein